MSKTLFPVKEYPNYLLNITFSGPSFDGRMEIGALGKEIQGLQEVLKIALHSLKKNKRTTVSIGDLEIYVGAFEKSSFRKRIQVFNKATGEYQPLIELALLVVMIFQTIPQYLPDNSGKPSAEFIAQVKDQVALELLQDKRFLAATANIVGSISAENDMCAIVAPDEQTAIINSRTSHHITELASTTEQVTEDGKYFEELKGRITRVDLDASRRHLGFKVDGEGATIDATFTQKPSDEEMKSLLGEWAEIKGAVQYVGGQRSHIDIQEYKVIQQRVIEFPE